MRRILDAYRSTSSATLLRVAMALILAAFLLSFWRWFTYWRRRHRGTFGSDRQSITFLIALLLVALFSMAAFIFVAMGQSPLW